MKISKRVGQVALERVGTEYWNAPSELKCAILLLGWSTGFCEDYWFDDLTGLHFDLLMCLIHELAERGEEL